LYFKCTAILPRHCHRCQSEHTTFFSKMSSFSPPYSHADHDLMNQPLVREQKWLKAVKEQVMRRDNLNF
jgi:hypothetical protein